MSSPSRPPRSRRGAALPLALLILVVSSLLAIGALTTGTQTFRAGRNALVEQRAFTVAEYGLNREISNWKRERNLPGGMAQGAVDSSRVYVAAGDTAKVKITRLGRMTFLVVSDGRAAIGSKALDSRRSVSAYVRLAYPSINPRGAITTAGDIKLSGSAYVTGVNTNPPGWTNAECDSLPGANTHAIVAAPLQDVDYKNHHLGGDLKVLYDPLAADSNTYVRYGTETWTSLERNADYRLPGGDFNWGIAPSLDAAGECNVGNTANWGEPRRGGADYVEKCINYFPIIYVDGDLHLRANSRGQGILLVKGDLEVNGTFDFTGLIIVKDDIERGNGTMRVNGAILAQNAKIVGTADDDGFLAGNQGVYYSRCALEKALRGSAILTRVTDRPFTQVF